MVASDDGGLIKIVSTAAGINSPATSNSDWTAIKNDRIAIDTGLTGPHAAGLFVELYPALNVGDAFDIDVFFAERVPLDSHLQIQTTLPVSMMECLTNINACDSALTCNVCSTCPAGQGQTSACTATEDTQCSACDPDAPWYADTKCDPSVPVPAFSDGKWSDASVKWW
jgi:hypothetical protein